MKFLGVIGITAAGILLGLVCIRRQHRRAAALSAALSLLSDFERRLQYTAPPLGDWLRASAADPAFAALSFVPAALLYMQRMDFAAAFTTALRDNGEADGLDAADILQLTRLGEQLGKSDAAMQTQCVRESIDRLRENRLAVQETVKKADKLYLTLGAGGGLALAVLLL